MAYENTKIIVAALVTSAFSLAANSSSAGSNIINWSSKEAKSRFEHSSHKNDFLNILPFFESQNNRVYSANAAAAVSLNYIHSKTKSNKIPVSKDNLSKEDYLKLPEGFNVDIKKFTQENIILNEIKTKHQILGDISSINSKDTRALGMSLSVLANLLDSHGAKIVSASIDEKSDLGKIKQTWISNIDQDNNLVIINYSRKSLGFNKDTQYALLGAYDTKTDSFLLLDFNTAQNEWFWIPFSELIKAMNVLEISENHGYIYVSTP